METTKTRWGRSSIPSPAENAELVARAQAGDLDARNECIVRNMPMVRWIAASFANRSPMADLEQEGALGLIEAIRHFDFGENVRFNTYAPYWIRQAIHNHVYRDRAIRVPNWLWDKSRIQRTKLKTKRGEESREECRRLAALARRRCVELDHAADVLAPECPDPDAWEELEMLRAAMDQLGDEDREILSLRYGIDCEPRFLREIAESRGVTKRAIGRREKAAMGWIRKLMGA